MFNVPIELAVFRHHFFGNNGAQAVSYEVLPRRRSRGNQIMVGRVGHGGSRFTVPIDLAFRPPIQPPVGVDGARVAHVTCRSQFRSLVGNRAFSRRCRRLQNIALHV